MGALASLLYDLDRVCAQFATALQGSELHLYTVLTLLIVLGVFLFPPKNDPDEI